MDREAFALCLTEEISKHPLIKIYREEVTEIDEQLLNIIATGPLTEGLMAETIKGLTGQEYFYFYDAAAPIVTADSVDYEKAFWASRYDKGEADYLNCPMNKKNMKLLRL